MNPSLTPPTSHVTIFPKLYPPQQHQNGETTTWPMQLDVSMDSIPGCQGQQESCRKARRLRFPRAAGCYNTLHQPLCKRRRWGIYRRPWKRVRCYHEEEERLPYKICNQTKFTTSRKFSENPRDRLVFSQQNQHHEIHHVPSSTPNDCISPPLAHIPLKMGSSYLSNNNRSSCASCGGPDSQLQDTTGVTSCFIKVIPISSPPHSSPLNILSQQAKTHDHPETNLMTLAGTLQNPNNNLVKMVTRWSANVFP